MPRGPLGRVGRRLAAPVLGLMILLVVVSTWLLYSGSGESRGETLDEVAGWLSRIVLNSLSDSMQAEDRPRLQAQIARLAEEESIQGVSIVNKAGYVVFDSDPAEVGRWSSQEDPGCRTCHGDDTRAPTKDRTLSVTKGGRRVVRAVRSIQVEKECTRCHEEPVGSVLGVLITDLDEDALTGHLRRRTGRAVGSVAGMALVVVLVLFFTIRRLVVARVRALRGLLNRLRSGARSMALAETSRDEIDDLGRSLQAFALDLDEELARQRAVNLLDRVLDAHPAPVLLANGEGTIVASNRRAVALYGPAGAVDLAGRRRQDLRDAPGELFEAAQEKGWALPPDDAPGPVVAALANGRGEVILYLEAWPEEHGSEEDDEATAGERASSAVGAAGWLLYGTILVEQARSEAKWWEGPLVIDRRVLLGRRLAREVAQAGEAIRLREEVDLDALTLITLQDVEGEVRGVEWHTLLGGPPKLLGARYQLRLLMIRLLSAAARQAGEQGHVLVFTRTDGSRRNVFLGAWASEPGGGALIDSPGGPGLAQAIAQSHGGGVEVDPEFDTTALTTSRRLKLPCGPVGSLFVVRLPISGAS